MVPGLCAGGTLPGVASFSWSVNYVVRVMVYVVMVGPMIHCLADEWLSSHYLE